MTFTAMHAFDCIHDAMAWLCGNRYMTKSPMTNWTRELQAWRDGDKVVLRLPHRHGCALACVPYTAEISEIIQYFATEPPLHEVTTVAGHA